jgi:hypothetical protein
MNVASSEVMGTNRAYMTSIQATVTAETEGTGQAHRPGFGRVPKFMDRLDTDAGGSRNGGRGYQAQSGSLA